MRHHQLQLPAARRHATPIVSPSTGLPLIKSTVSLGRRLEWRKARDTVDEDMPEDLKKRHVYEGFLTFVKWMEKEDGAHYRDQVKVTGPFPHFEAKQPDIQVGDRGATRPVARRIDDDVGGNGKEDYIIEALFDCPEYINEIPTDLAVDLFGKGKPGLAPLRQNEWMKTGSDSWSPKQ